VLPIRVGAQATVLSDPLDPTTFAIGRLVAEGLAPHAILGQQPLSRAEIRRLIRDAAVRIAVLEQTSIDSGVAVAKRERQQARLTLLREVIQTLKERIGLLDNQGDSTAAAPSIRLTPLRELRVDLTRVTSESRPVPTTNGIGSIDAAINPLLSNLEGRPLNEGNNVLFQTNHDLESRYVALAVQPELYFVPNARGEQRTIGRLQQLQLRALFRNFAIDVGREPLVWGQGRNVGLLGSDNSPPFDLIKLSSERPFMLPWFLRRLGPTRVALFYADLGADQNFPHPYLVGYKASISPCTSCEFGTTLYTKSGGQGSPRASWSARIIDALPFLDAAFFGGLIGTRGKFNFSDRYAGIDGRVGVPSVGGMTLYWEILLNDFDVRRLGSVFWEDAGHVFGLSLPHLTRSGRVVETVEYHHTGIRYYEHDQFTSGQTLHHVLIGDPLGPDAFAAYSFVDWYASQRQRLTLEGGLERRSNDLYVNIPEPHFGFRRVETRPREWRQRLVATWQVIPLLGRTGILSQVGYERTRNFNFVHGVDRNGFLGRVAVQYQLR
jgi:hypothetical protein